ncbi:hypothetical protein UXU46_08475 [Campylobacter jejuni]
MTLAIVSRVQADELYALPPPTLASRPIKGIRKCKDAFMNIQTLASW